MNACEIQAALRRPFAAQQIRWKPQTVTADKQRCLAVAYLDGHAVMDRLDEVFGVGGWQDSYQLLPDGSAVCTLRVLIAGHWIQKQDVAGASNQSAQWH